MPDFTGTGINDLFTFQGLNGGEVIDGLAGQDTIDGSALNNNYLYDLDSGVLSLTDGSLPASFQNFEVVLAGNGNDRLISGGGLQVNELDGGAGNDTLSPGSAGVRNGDIFAGGSGVNLLDLTGTTTGAVIDMNAGTLEIAGAVASISGFQQIIGGAGNDFIRERSGFPSELMGGLGNDTLATADSGITGGEVFDGGSGTDMLDFSNISSGFDANLEAGTFTSAGGNFEAMLQGIEQIDAGSGNDTLTVGSELGVQYTLLGNGGNDRLLGGAGNDILLGGSGGDALRGEAGNDALSGNAGNDVILGGAGFDLLWGDAGFDRLLGGAGNDRLDGGAQADNLLGEAGNDALSGGQGHDRLFGGDGNDRGFGGSENDALFGDNGNDTLNGQDGNDRVFGGFNNDLLGGDSGDDSLFGGAGFDTLIGGTGNDVLSGNFNADAFLFADFGGGFGQDTITDFAATNDFEVIDLGRVASIHNLFDLFSNHIAQVGQNVVIDALGGNTITLLNVDLSDLDRADFIF